MRPSYWVTFLLVNRLGGVGGGSELLTGEIMDHSNSLSLNIIQAQTTVSKD